ncbi:glycoside hydrolase 43 family protein [Caldalkalibacillus salinus]|uniref:glycoside hydrolase family 43 protein n=1 Tax=Caldalkalibacillus salinus TaxID=2803787 RepID=UPI001923CC33|nr:glycoside hydrolase 43 family protein [Caldalkalibacillus salinus]
MNTRLNQQRHRSKPRSNASVWQADLGDGHYRNPIIHADYSDPDVIRVGEDFYMVASSFNMSPCLPVLHSKDLVNWRLINNVSETMPFAKYDLPRHGEGVWAPSIRFHEGLFWVFFATPDEGVFMSTTDDPFGLWSPLQLVKACKGWIDPCPFWDDDGQAYLVHAFAKSRAGIKSKLQICSMKPDGTALLDEGIYVFDGHDHHPTIEGPKLYKHNGLYYIFAPAGGVTTGWQTVLRSKSIDGPYEDGVVLHQGHSNTNGPHQGAWVMLESGESWFVHFQDKGAYGRITHLQPMRWENDWPVIGQRTNKQEIGEPVERWKKPSVGEEAIDNPSFMSIDTSDDFKATTLGRQWQWRANVKKEWYTLTEQRLRLYAYPQPQGISTLYDTPQILTQKFPAPAFTATASISFYPQDDQDYAGLMICGQSYASIMVRQLGNGVQLLICEGAGGHPGEKVVESQRVIAHVNSFTFYLRVKVDDQARCHFSYSLDDQAYKLVDQPFRATPGKWVGAQLGMFALSKLNVPRSGYADVHWFKVSKS